MTVGEAFRDLTAKLASGKSAYILAELNDLLTATGGDQFDLLCRAIHRRPVPGELCSRDFERAAHMRRVFPPRWTADIPPLSKPAFAVPWQSLRAHLLLESPIPFRRRNIFINASIGARV